MIQAPPAIKLLPYQKKVIYDRSRFKYLLMARQSGKDFCTGLEITDDCMWTIAKGGRPRWSILAAGEAQAKRSLDDAVIPHMKAYGMMISDIEEREIIVGDDSYNALEIKLPNKGYVRAFAANPRTVRGISSNAWVNELAFIPDSRKMWGAFFPVVSSKPSLRVIVTTTPDGRDNKAYDLWHDETGVWSKHFCDIEMAIAQGLIRDTEELKAGMGDEFLWEQEFMCLFLDGLGAWLELEAIKAQEDARCIPEAYQGNECYVGMDIARVKDLTVIWVAEDVDGVMWTREVVEMKNATFYEQEQALGRVINDYRVRAVTIDRTGMGIPFVEQCQRNFGYGRVSGIDFTLPSKTEMAMLLKGRVQTAGIKFPFADEELRRDLTKVKRKSTNAGNFVFAANSDSSGHADKFWAAALMLMGAKSPIILPPDFATMEDVSTVTQEELDQWY